MKARGVCRLHSTRVLQNTAAEARNQRLKCCVHCASRKWIMPTASSGCTRSPISSAGQRRALLTREGKGSSLRRVVVPNAREDEADFDVSVFQFTLGIPGIPDEQVPRILGCVTIVLLGLNHLSAGSAIDAAQIRSEMIGLLLGLTCIALPSLNEIINFSNSSILSQSERTVPNTKEIFYLAEDKEEQTMGELAWNSFALLKNTNSSFILFAKEGELMLARGSFKIAGLPEGIPVTENYPMDKVFSKSFDVTGSYKVLKESTETTLYLENQGMIERQNLYADLCFLAKGIQSLIIAKSGEDRVIVVGANTPKAFSAVQQQWVVNIAKKLAAI